MTNDDDHFVYSGDCGPVLMNIFGSVAVEIVQCCGHVNAMVCVDDKYV